MTKCLFSQVRSVHMHLIRRNWCYLTVRPSSTSLTRTLTTLSSLNDSSKLNQACFKPSKPSLAPIKVVHQHFSGMDYIQAYEVQEEKVRQMLDFRAGKGPAVDPVIYTFEMSPVYTSGRRQRGHMSEKEIEYLRADGRAQFVETSRGGQTTFHGPGQLVAYPILDLKALKLPVKCYVDLLENAVINTLQRYGIVACKTENTGVWISDQEKIAAVGVHVRRYITSHGMALNVCTDIKWFERIVACGLPDKTTTTMQLQGVNDIEVKQVAEDFVEEFQILLTKWQT